MKLVALALPAKICHRLPYLREIEGWVDTLDLSRLG